MIAIGTLLFTALGIKSNVRTKFLAQVDAWVTAGSLDLAAANRLKQTVGDLVPTSVDTDGVLIDILIMNGDLSQLIITMKKIELA